ncbi:acyltransferase [Streptomyces sp. NPDC059816]|uniref:acyltransferase family protein n=1 Tax=Streptomyces sp. NPDC059816 TaxID=3346960 RepID=UPI0036648014
MGTRFRETERLAGATPAHRDRYMDLLRVASLGIVVLGHWLMAAVTIDADGAARVGNLLAEVPRAQILTWVFQVMPVFFFVGGFAHALSYRSLVRRHPDTPPYAGFLRARLRRLLRPTMAFVLVWGAVALGLALAGADDARLDAALRLVTQPLWFVGIYLAMAALTPPLLRAHDRWGWGAFFALAGAAVLVDVARLALGVPYVEFLNFAFVWLAVHQLGFLRADGALRRPPLLAGAGLLGAAALVALGPYPLSMVGMPGERISNMAPPTLALLCHGLWLVGAVESLRSPAARLLARPRVWRGVVVAGGFSMTAFLWHLTAMLGVYGVLFAWDVPLSEPASGVWWAQVPLRLGAALALTVLLVAVFSRFERPAPGGPVGGGRGAGAVAATGVTLALFGVLGLSMVGFADLLEGHGAVLVAVRVTAPTAVALAVAGWLLVERAGSSFRRTSGARSEPG